MSTINFYNESKDFIRMYNCTEKAETRKAGFDGR